MQTQSDPDRAQMIFTIATRAQIKQEKLQALEPQKLETLLKIIEQIPASNIPTKEVSRCAEYRRAVGAVVEDLILVLALVQQA